MLLAMAPPVPPAEAAIATTRASTDRFITLLRGVADPRRNAIGHWSIGDTAAHVSHVFAMCLKAVRGEVDVASDHRQIDVHWGGRLAEEPERSPRKLAERISSLADEFFSHDLAGRWTEELTWHGHLQVPIYTFLTILTSETSLHGRDIATAEKRPWSIPRDAAAFGVEGLMPVLPYFVNEELARDLACTYALHIRGGHTTYVTVNHGALSFATEAHDNVDCHINADPLAYLLVGYGRIPQVLPILTGKILAYGKRPWLALKFGKLFVSV